MYLFIDFFLSILSNQIYTLFEYFLESKIEPNIIAIFEIVLPFVFLAIQKILIFLNTSFDSKIDKISHHFEICDI